LQARSQAAITAASKQTGRLCSLKSEVASLEGVVGNLEAELRQERSAGEEARGSLVATAAALANESEARTCDRRDAERAQIDAQSAIASLKSDIGEAPRRKQPA